MLRSQRVLRRVRNSCLGFNLHSTVDRKYAMQTICSTVKQHNHNEHRQGYKFWSVGNKVTLLLASAVFLGALQASTDSTNATYCDASVTSNTAASTIDAAAGVAFETGQSLTNWSSTHSCQPSRLYEPSNAQEVCRVIEAHHKAKRKIRPVGTALSPNGIGMAERSNTDLLSVAALDYIEVDTKRSLVTVGAGARVADVLKELKKHGLTLENFSSIQEQQLGGWTQVAAHGTGCSLPTVDEMIVRMQLATATEGLLTLSELLNPTLFRMCKVGLGSLGVVTELTMRCIPSHQLHERMYSTTIDSIQQQHQQRLRNYRHVRYMWMPHTESVAVVVSNAVDGIALPSTATSAELAQVEVHTNAAMRKSGATTTTAATASLVDLYLRLNPSTQRATVEKLSFSQLRDLLLDIAPLNAAHIKQVNRAEADFWKQATGERTADSTEILGFDCGGEQWVLEVCFPMGSITATTDAENKQSKDLKFVKELLLLIKKHDLPAPCPIEQRWTARSTSPMSPAYSEDPDEIFSWVGVIMYLPPGQTESQRADITAKFREYTQLMRPLLEEYNAHPHWAKIELPHRANNSSNSSDGSSSRSSEGAESVGHVEMTSTALAAAAVAAADSSKLETCPSWFGTTAVPKEASRYGSELAFMRQSLARRYPVDSFNDFREALDPHFVLSNELIDALFNKKQ